MLQVGSLLPGIWPPLHKKVTSQIIVVNFPEIFHQKDLRNHHSNYSHANWQYIRNNNWPPWNMLNVLRNFAKFTRKHLYQSLFLNKIAGWPATLAEKSLWHRCFPVNSAKFLGTPFLENTSERLFLAMERSTFSQKLVIATCYMRQFYCNIDVSNIGQ